MTKDLVLDLAVAAIGLVLLVGIFVLLATKVDVPNQIYDLVALDIGALIRAAGSVINPPLPPVVQPNLEIAH